VKIGVQELESFNKNYHPIDMRRETYNQFRHLCREHSLAATHQRQKIYEALVSRPGHYSPEEIYEQVKRDLPSISLATVYKNLKTFVQAGLVREVAVEGRAARFDVKGAPHHHFICDRCGNVEDIEWYDVPTPASRSLGTRILRECELIFRGLCTKCAPRQASG
jgi:Fur family transcriptional regulator, peroxide stress response regulator